MQVSECLLIQLAIKFIFNTVVQMTVSDVSILQLLPEAMVL
jgi:hypothetical protein